MWFVNVYLEDNIFKRVRAHLFVQLNGFKYSYQTWIIRFTIEYLFAHSYMVSSIAL